MNYNALHNFILIKPDPVKETTDSGIIVTNEKQTTYSGEILNVGSKVEQLVAGDNVLYTSWAYEQLSLEGEVYHLVDQRDVLALIDANPVSEPSDG